MRLKIGAVSTISWRTPPKKYGSYEYIASLVAEELVRRGHQVTLFATGDSQTVGKLSWVCPRPLLADKTLDAKVYEYLHLASVSEKASSFDIIHNHYGPYLLAFSPFIKTPILTTVHGVVPSKVPLYQKYPTPLVAISQAEKALAPNLNWVGVVYHGIPVGQFPFSDRAGDYLLYLGRIAEERGVDLVISLAREAGKKLILAGLLPSHEKDFFQTKIEPKIDGKEIQYLGEVSFSEKLGLLKNALAFVHLNRRPEGLGIGLVEAQACGTPVIGFNRGSVPEVVKDGGTGFVVENLDEAGEAVKRVNRLSRSGCRRWVEKNFTVEKMVDGYERLYNQLLRKQ